MSLKKKDENPIQVEHAEVVEVVDEMGKDSNSLETVGNMLQSHQEKKLYIQQLKMGFKDIAEKLKKQKKIL